MNQSEDKIPMTQETWELYLCQCVQAGNIKQFNALWNHYPIFAEHMMQELENIASQYPIHATEEASRASWERLKKQLP